MFLILFFACIGVSDGGFVQQATPNCSVDGVLWWGCGSYGRCDRGQYSQVDCIGAVFDRRSGQCTDISQAQFPCNQPAQDCRDYLTTHGHRKPLVINEDPDGLPCAYYYTCRTGRFLAYQACPQGMAYDEGQQRCEDRAKVPPPCGFASPQPDFQNQFGQGGFNNQNRNLNQNQNQQNQNQNQNRNQNQQNQNRNQNRNQNQQNQDQQNQNRNQNRNQNQQNQFSQNQNQNQNQNPFSQNQNRNQNQNQNRFDQNQAGIGIDNQNQNQNQNRGQTQNRNVAPNPEDEQNGQSTDTRENSSNGDTGYRSYLFRRYRF